MDLGHDVLGLFALSESLRPGDFGHLVCDLRRRYPAGAAHDNAQAHAR